jgi:hypothetical protein
MDLAIAGSKIAVVTAAAVTGSPFAESVTSTEADREHDPH